VHHSSQNVNIFNDPKNPRFPTEGFVRVKANAKINLYLDVVGKRADGYHELNTVMQSLDVCDDIEIMRATKAQHFQVQLTTNIPFLSTGKHNLIIKAATALLEHYQIKDQLHINLTKRIPIGAGLGGGSSNAAATIRGLATLFNLKPSPETLNHMAKNIGADVPFCLSGGTQMATGIGEILTPLPEAPDCYIVLVIPRIHIATPKIFSMLNAPNISSDIAIAADKKFKNFIKIYKSCDIYEISLQFYNIFSKITPKMHPIVLEYVKILINNGAMGACMSGTGPSVYGYYDSMLQAQRAYEKFLHKDVHVFLTKTTKREEWNS